MRCSLWCCEGKSKRRKKIQVSFCIGFPETVFQTDKGEPLDIYPLCIEGRARLRTQPEEKSCREVQRQGCKDNILLCTLQDGEGRIGNVRKGAGKEALPCFSAGA